MKSEWLGQEVRDLVTGITGIVTGHTIHLNLCERICIQPRSVDNKPATEVEWVDVQQAELVGRGVRDRLLDSAKTAAPVTGGPQKDAPRF